MLYIETHRAWCNCFDGGKGRGVSYLSTLLLEGSPASLPRKWDIEDASGGLWDPWDPWSWVWIITHLPLVRGSHHYCMNPGILYMDSYWFACLKLLQVSFVHILVHVITVQCTYNGTCTQDFITCTYNGTCTCTQNVITWAVRVRSARSCAVKAKAASTGPFSQGSYNPEQPRTKKMVAMIFERCLKNKDLIQRLRGEGRIKSTWKEYSRSDTLNDSSENITRTCKFLISTDNTFLNQ